MRVNAVTSSVALAAAAGLLGGFALAPLFSSEAASSRSAQTGPDRADRTIPTDSRIEARVRALESALDTEREARQLLEDELFALYDAIDRSRAPDEPAMAAGDVRAARSGRVRRVPSGRADGASERVGALTTAGFSYDRAEWIIEREAELRMEAMQARYDAMRLGEPVNRYDPLLGPAPGLRDELGDAEYERYLEALGRPTRVGIAEVIASSPAGSAGIEPGDEITHYDGERVFGTADLVRRTMKGEPGENVVVTIVRDGAPMQIVLPRGPLGISTRWRR